MNLLASALVVLPALLVACSSSRTNPDTTNMPDLGFELTTPTTTSVRITKGFAAPVEYIWRAHTDAELVKQWMSGPPDHSMPVCEIDLRVGGRGRYVWKSPEFELGMWATFKEVTPHERIVHTEIFDGWPEGQSTVTTTFASAGDGSTITIDIQYLGPEALEAVMQPGFEEGYAASYKKLDRIIARDS